jgi:DNA-binding NarL/FixJ family response regulator
MRQPSTQLEIVEERHAVKLYRHSTEIRMALVAGWQAPDLLGVGVIVCEPDGHVLIANNTARELLRAQDGLRLTEQGYLREAGQQTERLAQTLEEVSTSSSAETRRTVVRVRRTSGKPSYVVLLRRHPGDCNEARPAVLLVILNPDTAPQDAPVQLRHEFTPAESQLARFLMRGHTLHECERKLRSDRSTLDALLADMCKKTNTCSQIELISFLTKTSRPERESISARPVQNPWPSAAMDERVSAVFHGVVQDIHEG